MDLSRKPAIVTGASRGIARAIALEMARRTEDLTMWDAFHLSRNAANQMIHQGREGVLLAVSSPHAFSPVSKSMAYNMATAAVDEMARTAVVGLAEHRNGSNVVDRGGTDTPGERRFNDEQRIKSLSEQLLWKRLARPRKPPVRLYFYAIRQMSSQRDFHHR